MSRMDWDKAKERDLIRDHGHVSIQDEKQEWNVDKMRSQHPIKWGHPSCFRRTSPNTLELTEIGLHLLPQ